MAALAREADGTVDVPPTIRALLQARLDALNHDERVVVDRGAVEGQVFHRGAVMALAPATPQVDVPGQLLSLVRKEVVRPDRAVIPGDDAFRFRHLLIRDTAYEGLPKAVRADLHERFADWLDANVAARRAGRDRRLPPRAGMPVTASSSTPTIPGRAALAAPRGRAPRPGRACCASNGGTSTRRRISCDRALRLADDGPPRGAA